MSLKALSLSSPLNASLEDALFYPKLLLCWGSGSALTPESVQGGHALYDS